MVLAAWLEGAWWVRGLVERRPTAGAAMVVAFATWLLHRGSLAAVLLRETFDGLLTALDLTQLALGQVSLAILAAAALSRPRPASDPSAD